MRTKSSRSENGDRWLSSVMQDYAVLVRQWSALSMTIRSARHAGLPVSLAPSSAPELRVSQAPATLPPTGGAIGISIDSPPYAASTTNSLWNQSLDQATLRLLEPSTPVPPMPAARTRGKSSSSKRVICPTSVRRSSK